MQLIIIVMNMPIKGELGLFLFQNKTPKIDFFSVSTTISLKKWKYNPFSTLKEIVIYTEEFVGDMTIDLSDISYYSNNKFQTS